MGVAAAAACTVSREGSKSSGCTGVLIEARTFVDVRVLLLRVVVGAWVLGRGERVSLKVLVGILRRSRVALMVIRDFCGGGCGLIRRRWRQRRYRRGLPPLLLLLLERRRPKVESLIVEIRTVVWGGSGCERG